MSQQVETRFKIARVRSPKHLAWIREHPCIVPRCRQGEIYGIHAHHVRVGAGTALKPGDDHVVSCCPNHHHEIHQRGAKSFEQRYGLNLTVCAAWLAFHSRCLGILK